MDQWRILINIEMGIWVPKKGVFLATEGEFFTAVIFQLVLRFLKLKFFSCVTFVLQLLFCTGYCVCGVTNNTARGLCFCFTFKDSIISLWFDVRSQKEFFQHIFLRCVFRR